MENELNPCVKCGSREIITDTDEEGNWATGCTNCGGYAEGCDATDSRNNWNAANPKEGKPNDTQTV